MSSMGTHDRSDRAVFRQIADQLRDAIQRELREGDKLPSEAQMTAHYGVTHMTARNALQLLQAEGLVVPRRRAGRIRTHATADY